MRKLFLHILYFFSCAFPAVHLYGIAQIQGTVTNQSNGKPVVAVSVKVLDANDARIQLAETLTDAAGFYDVSVDGPGLYKVLVDLTVGNPLADQFYGGGIRHSGASLIIIDSDGETKTGIDISLPRGYSIVGQVTGGGEALEDIDLDVYYESSESIRSINASTTAGGFYELGPFPDGNYLVRADPSASLEQPYLEKFYGGNSYIGSADKIIIAGASATAIDIDLEPAAIIRGLITDTFGTPLDDIDFDVFDPTGSRLIYSGRSQADGKYFVGPLPKGSYYLKADPTKNSGYGMQFYPRSLTLSDAKLIAVADGQITSEINFYLPPAGTISGHITDLDSSSPLSFVDLDIYNLDGDRLEFSALSDFEGAYTIGPLPIGDYIIKCDPSPFSGYVEQYYSEQIARSAAWPVTVEANTDTSNINFSLRLGGPIKGVVLDSGGSPLAGVDLDIFDSNGARLDYSSITSTDGTFSIGPVLDGVYYVLADPDPALGQLSIATFYGDVTDLEAASPVTVSGGATDDVDINLEYGGLIGGTISDQNSNPIAGMDLDVFDSEGNLLSYSTTTGSDGSYLLGAMPAGDYIVRADTPDKLRFISEYYNDVLERDSATAVSVSANVTTSSIDFNLAVGGSISGTVSDSEGSPLEGIDLDVYDADRQFFNASAATKADGSFIVNGLPDGDYYLRADPDASSGQFYVAGFAGGALSLANASPITLDGTDVSGVSISLQFGGTISGMVRGEDGLGLSNVDIDIYDTEGRLLPFDADTDNNGNYLVGPLPIGQYLVKAESPEGSNYTTLYYDARPVRDNAVPVSVTSESETTGIDFDLFKGGWISGTILSEDGSPLDDVDLDIFSADGDRVDTSTRSEPDGSYLLGPVPAGDYLIRADPDDTTGYLILYYPDALDSDDANPVTVAATQTTTGIDYSLPVAGWIEGLVTDEFGTPLPDIDLDAFEAGTLDRLTQGGKTGEDGRYTVGPLPVGDIIVRADPTIEQRRVREYYSEGIALSTATPIAVSAGVATPDINFTLAQGSYIGGTVTDPADRNPVAGVDIDIFRASDMFKMDQNAKTQADGSYSIGPLPEGTYIVKFDARSSTAYLDIFYDGTEDVSSAIPIELTAGLDVVGIDSTLPVFTLFPEIFPLDGSGSKGLTFRWQSQIGKEYIIEYSDDLATDSWIPLVTIEGDGSIASYEVEIPLGITRRFFRIRINSI